MIEREVKAHSSVNHPNVMPLIDHEVVVKGENKEARLLFPYHKVYEYFIHQVSISLGYSLFLKSILRRVLMGNLYFED